MARKVISAPLPMEPSKFIDREITGLKDWRSKMLASIRKTIHDADPEVIEEWKWMGTPTWSHDGILLIANAHKDKIKMTFPMGAKLPDPDKIFNNGFGGSRWRAIDLYEDDKINERALKNMVRAAVAYNHAELKAKTKFKGKKK